MRFITTSLRKLVDNFSEVIHKVKRKECRCSFKYESVKNNFMECKCLSCNKYYQEKLNEELKKKSEDTFRFFDNDINKFMLLLRKVVYPYDHMNEWERFNEIDLPEKEKLYNRLNMEDIAELDYVNVKRVYKDLEMKNFGEYHDSYLKSDVLFLADVFENIRKMCLEIYELYPAKFISVPDLAWQAALKKAQVKSDLIADIYMLLMIKKGIRGRICNAAHHYAKANNKYMQDYDENKQSSCLNYQDVNNFQSWAMS